MFSFGSTGSAKSSLYNLHFTLSGYFYTIYQYSAAFDEEGSGIRVKTPDGNFSYLRCKESSLPVNLYILNDLGLRKLPLEALVSSDSDETWPAESPNTDLLQGVRTHDFALVSRALANGADVNFHPQNAIGVLGALADERSGAIRQNRVAEFDEETDRLLTLLLSRGASPTISTQNGGTAIDFLANNAPYQTIRKLLDIGWPNDYQYRLYVGALLGNPELVQEALSHGADPNATIRGGRYLNSALTQACLQAGEGRTERGDQALAALELLLKSGATIDEGKGREGGGDIVRTYAYWGNHPNWRPIFELLIQYASPNARNNALIFLRPLAPRAQFTVQRELSAWLLKRLDQKE
jgi:ankyrin repeat protein